MSIGIASSKYATITLNHVVLRTVVLIAQPSSIISYNTMFELFLQGRSPVQVAIDLDLETGKVMTFLYDFLRLQNMHRAASILKEHKDQLAPLVKVLKWLRKNNTRVKDIRYAMNSISF